MTVQAILKIVTEADAQVVTELSRVLFSETFAQKMAHNYIDNYLNQEYTIEVIRGQILKPDNLFVLALAQGKAIGYMKLVDKESENALEVDKLYLSRNYQGKGIGKHLMAFAEETARQKGRQSITLVVWEKNLSAFDFYKYLGYTLQYKLEKDRGGQTQIGLCLKKNIDKHIDLK